MPSKRTIYVLLLVIVLLSAVASYYSGPPAVRSRCTSFMPVEERQSSSQDFCAQFNNKLNQLKSRVIDYEVKRGDTLTEIAFKLGSSKAVIECLNPIIENEDFILFGREIRVAKGELHLEVDLSTNTLTVFIDEITLKRYSVATGRGGMYASPTGQFRIREIVWDPYDYRSLASFRDSKNRFGKAWLSLDIPEYGIHGTNDPDSIGQPTSRGCIRMFNDDVAELAIIVTIGTRVEIKL